MRFDRSVLPQLRLVVPVSTTVLCLTRNIPKYPRGMEREETTSQSCCLTIWNFYTG